MSYPPPRLRETIPDLAYSPTCPSRRPAVGCGESTHSPLPSPRICSGSALASWLATADPCVASTHKHFRDSPRPTHRRLRYSHGSKSPSLSPHTSACVRSAVVRTPVVGLVSLRLHSNPGSLFLVSLARYAGPTALSACMHHQSILFKLPFSPPSMTPLANPTPSFFGSIQICQLKKDDDSHHQSGTLAFHPLFYYLHFSPGAELDPTAVLHSLLPTHPDCRRKLYAPLCGHASAACAFATSPPVRSITLLRPDSDCAIASVRNPDGCTLLDVNRLLGDLYVKHHVSGTKRTDEMCLLADSRAASPICAPCCPTTRRYWTTIVRPASCHSLRR